MKQRKSFGQTIDKFQALDIKQVFHPKLNQLKYLVIIVVNYTIRIFMM